MPRLDLRLKVVAQQIRSAVHVDIGSDHGKLLVALLKSGRINHGIAIENKRQPLENSRAALAGLSADVLFGDGLAPLEADDVDSLSICGMGAGAIVKILEAYPDRVPTQVVLQPNRQPELIRDWALRSSFHFLDEQVASGHWPYAVMSFKRAGVPEDPAYESVDAQQARLFGPLVIKRGGPELMSRLRDERDYLMGLKELGPTVKHRLAVIEAILSDHGT